MDEHRQTDVSVNTSQPYSAICKQAFSVCTRHYVSKENQVLKPFSNTKLMSVIASHFQLLRASSFPAQMCEFMLVKEELAVRVSVEQPLVSPL